MANSASNDDPSTDGQTSKVLYHGEFKYQTANLENGPFVFVPKNYDFQTKDGMKHIFDALGIDFPEFVFHFFSNYGVAPLGDEMKKTIKEHFKRGECSQDVDSYLCNSTAKLGTFVKHRQEKERKESYVFSALSAIPREGSLFLISKPYGGNRLSYHATKAAKRNDITSLALLTCDKDGSPSNRISYLDDGEAEGIVTDKGIDLRRKFLSAKDFSPKPVENEQRSRVPIGDKVEKAIKVMADYTKKEYDFYHKYSQELMEVRPFVPGLLADECTHRLVFEKQASLDAFQVELQESAWSAVFAAGNSLSTFRAVKESIQKSKPIIVLEGTGPVSDIAYEFERKRSSLDIQEVLQKYKKGKEHKDNLKSRKIAIERLQSLQKYLDFIGFVDDGLVDETKETTTESNALDTKSLIEKEKEYFSKSIDTKKIIRWLFETRTVDQIKIHRFFSLQRAISDIKKAAQKAGHSFLDESGKESRSDGIDKDSKIAHDEAFALCSSIEDFRNGNFHHICIIPDIKGYSTPNASDKNGNKPFHEIQNEIIKLMGRDFSNDEYEGHKLDRKVIAYSRQMQAILGSASKREKYVGFSFVVLISVFTVIPVVLAAVTLNSNTKKQDLIMVLTVILTLIRSLDSTFTPIAKYAKLRLARAELESEEYRFRTRTGVYKPLYGGGYNNMGEARNLFLKNTSEIFHHCMEAETKQAHIMPSTEAIRLTLSQCFRNKNQGDDNYDDEERSFEKVQFLQILHMNIEELNLDTDDLDDYHQLSLDDYVDHRLRPSKNRLHGRASRKATLRNFLRGFLLTGTALTPVFSAKIFGTAEKTISLEKWVPLLLVLVDALKDLIQFFQLDNEVTSTNDAIVEIEYADTIYVGIGEKYSEKKCLQVYKDDIVNRVEIALLDRVRFSVKQIENSKRKKDSSPDEEHKSTLRRQRVGVEQEQQNKGQDHD